MSDSDSDNEEIFLAPDEEEMIVRHLFDGNVREGVPEALAHAQRDDPDANEDPAVAMFRRIRRDFRLVRRHQDTRQQAVHLRVQQSLNMLMCNRTNCPTCASKIQVGRDHPDSVFRPHSLKQQILLELARMFFGKTTSERESAVGQLGLPDPILVELNRVFEEMELWRREFVQILDLSTACYVPSLHWHSRGMLVNWRKSAEMIAENRAIGSRAVFLLCALCCLENRIQTAWNRLDAGVKHQLTTHQSTTGEDNPILTFWIVKCLGRPVSQYLSSVISYCIRKGYQEVLEYFWPLAVEEASSTSYLFDHSFHQAIEFGSKSAAYFIWTKATRKQRVSMMSAASCCSTSGSFYGFECAVAAGYTDIVRFLWQKTTDKEHNGMLLAEHCNSFCLAAGNGSEEIVQMMWNETTNTQKFVLLFEQSAAAFRKAAENGHFKIVKLLWSAASDHQRRQLLGVAQGEAFTQTAAKGNWEILQYLWSEMSQDSREYFLISILGPCLRKAVEHDKADTVKFLMGLPDESGLRRAIWNNRAEAFWAAFKLAEDTNYWTYAVNFHRVLTEEQQTAVRDAMAKSHSDLAVERFRVRLTKPELFTAFDSDVVMEEEASCGCSSFQSPALDECTEAQS